MVLGSIIPVENVFARPRLLDHRRQYLVFDALGRQAQLQIRPGESLLLENDLHPPQMGRQQQRQNQNAPAHREQNHPTTPNVDRTRK